MKSLYFCYQSINEPLTQTQVISYLDGLARAGHAIRLVTFEPAALSADQSEFLRIDLANRGISWSWLRYHKRPTLPATMFDVFVGAWVGLRIKRTYGVDLVHARGQVAGVMGLIMKALSRTKLLFDMRGLLAEEYADAGVWRRGGFLYGIAKRAEGVLLRNADGIVVLTNKATGVIRARDLGGRGVAPVEVIPCCVDLRGYDFSPAYALHEDELRLVYVGKLGGWYWDEAMIKFLVALHRIEPKARLAVFTQSNSTSFESILNAHDVSGLVTIRQVAPDALPRELRAGDAGLSFIRPSLSKTVSSPTKIGEYLAAGLPVVSTSGIGDLDDMLSGGGNTAPIGVLVGQDVDSEYDRAGHELIALLQAPQVRERCRAAARRQLDLETVGWTRYRRVYERLA